MTETTLFSMAAAGSAKLIGTRPVQLSSTTYNQTLGQVIFDPPVLVYLAHDVYVSSSTNIAYDFSGRPIFETKFPLSVYPELSDAQRQTAEQAPSDQNFVLLASDPNFYHWLLNWMPRLFFSIEVGRQSLSNLRPVFGSQPPAFQFDSLALVDEGLPDRAMIVGERGLTFFPRLLIASFVPNPIHSPAVVRRIRELGLQDAPEQPAKERILITRRDAPGGRRQIINQDELEREVARYGFEAVELTGKKFTDQAALFAGCRYLVSPHGAGLTNMIFMKPGFHAIELQAAEHYTRVYWSLASLAGAGTYSIVPSQTRGDGPAYLRDLVVDVPALGSALEKMLQLPDKS